MTAMKAVFFIYLFLLLVILTLYTIGADAKYNGTYAFYRSINKKAQKIGTRRVFGGEEATVEDFPNICALTDWGDNIKCSCSIVGARWALTSAHCITPVIAYVQYNTRMPSADPGDIAKVDYGYIHPKFKVVQKDEGRGMDVVGLQHDIGLVRTIEDMYLYIPLTEDPLRRISEPRHFMGKRLQILGFGSSDHSTRAVDEQLFSTTLRMLPCERQTWYPCICGLSEPGLRSTGVCTGDSGGPVLLDGAQVAITSMGPVECASRRETSPEATSVFTLVGDYAHMINRTIANIGDTVMKPIKLGVKRSHDQTAMVKKQSRPASRASRGEKHSPIFCLVLVFLYLIFFF